MLAQLYVRHHALTVMYAVYRHDKETPRYILQRISGARY